MGFVPARRDDGAAAVTVTGTVTANQGTAGAGAWPVDASGAVVPISAAALPLPVGAATEATLQALQVALEALDTTVTVDGDRAQAVYDPRVRQSLEMLRLQLELEADAGA